jgi:hypothetical protein
MSADQPGNDDQQSPSSLPWTSSRADHMYFALHAPVERMLEYFGIEPVPDAPPSDWDSHT